MFSLNVCFIVCFAVSVFLSFACFCLFPFLGFVLSVLFFLSLPLVSKSVLSPVSVCYIVSFAVSVYFFFFLHLFVVAFHVSFILALVGFNFVLYITLKQRYALYYCCYISCFIIVNLSYNGFGFAWFYPDSVFIQNYCTLIFMILHGVTGLAFVSSFLFTQKYMPRFSRLIVVLCLRNVLLGERMQFYIY